MISKRPFLEYNELGEVVAVRDDGLLRVDIQRGWFEPKGFGDWIFTPGDQVVVGNDVDGSIKIFPAVVTVKDAPQLATNAKEFRVGKYNVTVSSDIIADELRFAIKDGVEVLVYLLIENHKTDQTKIWGVFNPSDSDRGKRGLMSDITQELPDILDFPTNKL